MYDFYVILPNTYDTDTNFEKKLNLGYRPNNVNVSIYKINDIEYYINMIRNKDPYKNAIVSDMNNTLLIGDNHKYMMNEPVLNYMYSNIQNGHSLFICTLINTFKWIDVDIELYYKTKEIYKLLPDYQNYIMCTGNVVAKRYFMDSLSKFYDNVKMLLDDRIDNLVTYYDPDLKINEKSNIPIFALYDQTNSNKDYVIKKIKCHILLKLYDDDIKKNNIDNLPYVFKKSDYDLKHVVNFLNKRINIDKNVYDKVNKYYMTFVKNNYMIFNDIELKDMYNKTKKIIYETNYVKYYSKYLTNKIGGGHYILEKHEGDNIKYYCRAGILLINNKKKSNPTIILLNNRKWNVYTIPGGRVDINKGDFDYILAETAIRELEEETLNTFVIDKDILLKTLYVDVYDNKIKQYNRIYLISFQTDYPYEKIYYSNLSELSKENVPYYWKETNKMKHFNVNDLILNINKSNTSNNIYCKDINGSNLLIYSNTVNILFNILIKQKKIYDDVLNTLHKLEYYNSNKQPEHDFLKSTKQLKIVN
jgi:hypothetical protein